MRYLKETTVGNCRVTFKGAWISEADFEKTAGRVVPILEALQTKPFAGRCRARWTALVLTVWIFDRFRNRGKERTELAADCQRRDAPPDLTHLKDALNGVGAACIVDSLNKTPMILISKRCTDFVIFHELSHPIMIRKLAITPRVVAVMDGKNIAPAVGDIVDAVYGVLHDLATFQLAVEYPEYAQERLQDLDKLFRRYRHNYLQVFASTRHTYPVIFHLNFCHFYGVAVLAHRLGDEKTAKTVLSEMKELHTFEVMRHWCGSEAAKQQFRSDVDDWYAAFNRIFDEEINDFAALTIRYILPLLKNPQQYCREEGTLVDIDVF